MVLEVVRTVSWLLGGCGKTFLGGEEVYLFFFSGVTLQNECSFGVGEGQGREGARHHHWGQ